ncbi:thiamine pyrophosphate-binding protein [Halomonas sp. IOP_14]|uniref:thiamine pyrophosphate-dependent enzyme n=1 Tax=Halomonas sp. IOP_14 TaxID=2873295 RepID=UPI001E4C9671|nr:thiamine pyrophosphate-binding protein [Halomonas sp. IOP_14]MCD1585062.1 thiamine pyrophosphate-binding protein [Halomonas sp. IOP_14]
MSHKSNNDVPCWGSDAIAKTLQGLELNYIALNPGASYRGLHDSLVNFTHNDPRLLLCVHEEAAVAIAHGYAKVTGRAMGVALHSNVGLMHGSMGIYNAWCDRVPMVVLGATGPVDATQRRSWIDWIHTSQDQGSLIRDFVKWDDQPGGVTATLHALVEGVSRAGTAPRGPVYINIDAALQEKALDAPLPEIDISRRGAPRTGAPVPDLVNEAAMLLSGAKKIVVLMGRMSHDYTDWTRRIAFVERLGAQVVTDFKTGATFPSAHGANIGHAGYFPDPKAKAAIAEAEIIVNLDWLDFGGTLRSVFGDRPVPAKIISATIDVHNHRGWVKDGGAPAPADVAFLNEPDQVVAALVEALEAQETVPLPALSLPDEVKGGTMTSQDIAVLLRRGVNKRSVCLIRAPLSWTGADWPVSHPFGSLGYDGGGGIGSGPGMAVGAALALRDEGLKHLPLAVLGDGDFLMNASALWTAVNQGVPLMIVVVNNHSFYNDEVHQESVAKERERPVENKHVGIVMNGPDIDVSAIAQGFGATSYGLLTSPTAVMKAISNALEVVESGGVAVLEIEAAKGYAPSMVQAMRSAG